MSSKRLEYVGGRRGPDTGTGTVTAGADTEAGKVDLRMTLSFLLCDSSLL